MKDSRKARDSYWDAVKGFAILLVVTIHYLGGRTGDAGTYLCRQFASIAVFMFVFVAGYFTNMEGVKADAWGFVRRRLLRLFTPYAIWSAITLLVFRPTDFLDFRILVVHDFLLGYGVSIGYYVMALAQLTILTPFIARVMADREKTMLVVAFLITLGSCLVNTLTASGFLPSFGLSVPVPYPGVFFAAWIFPYVLGIAARRYRDELTAIVDRRQIVVIAVCVVMFLCVLAQNWVTRNVGFVSQPQFNLTGNLFAACCCLAAVGFAHKAGENVFAVLGRGSFLVYLTHLKLFVVFRHLLPRWFGFRGGDMTILPYLAGLAAVAFVYWMTVRMSEKMLPLGIRRLLAIS